MIGVSGIPYLIAKPYLFNIPQLNILTLLFIYSAYKFLSKNNKLDNYFILIIIILIYLIVDQTIWFRTFEFEQAISLLVRFSIPYFVIKLTKDKFMDYYIHIIYVLAVISLILFIPSQISSTYNSIVNNIGSLLNLDEFAHRKSFIIYSIDNDHTRNAGPFWEAGAFCAFLLIAMIFHLIKHKTIKTREFGVFTIALLTTYSTAGYLAFFFLLGGYYFFLIKSRLKLIVMPLLLGVFIYTFITQEFLQEKIEQQVTTQLNAVDREKKLGRFQSAILDFIDISESPIFGRGRGENRYNENEFFIDYGAARRSNGITDFTAKMGIPFSILYFLLVLLSLKKVILFYKAPTMLAVIAFFTILIIAFSQLLFTNPLFAGLIFLFIPYKNETIVNGNNNHI